MIRPQTHGNLSETGIEAANLSILDTATTKELSSLAHYPTACRNTIFWLSLEAFICSSLLKVKLY